MIDENNEQLGIMQTRDAQMLARERGLDLVEVAPTAVPPVCRLMDYGKFRYDQDKREREARKTQKTVTIKEVRLAPNMDDHDIDVKINMVRRFLEEGDKVKLTVQFRGRQITHQELGRVVLDRMSEQLREIGTIEQMPKTEGRNMTMVISPRAERARTTPRPPREKREPTAEAGNPPPAGTGALAEALTAAGATTVDDQPTVTAVDDQPTATAQPAADQPAVATAPINDAPVTDAPATDAPATDAPDSPPSTEGKPPAPRPSRAKRVQPAATSAVAKASNAADTTAAEGQVATSTDAPTSQPSAEDNQPATGS